MNDENPWMGKGKTLSHKSAMKKYGLTKEEIFIAMKKGKLQFREQSTYGSPWYRLLTTEVEKLVIEKQGENYLERKNLEKDLKKVKKQIRKHKRELKKLKQKEEGITDKLDKL